MHHPIPSYYLQHYYVYHSSVWSYCWCASSPHTRGTPFQPLSQYYWTPHAACTLITCPPHLSSDPHVAWSPLSPHQHSSPITCLHRTKWGWGGYWHDWTWLGNTSRVHYVWMIYSQPPQSWTEDWDARHHPLLAPLHPIHTQHHHPWPLCVCHMRQPPPSQVWLGSRSCTFHRVHCTRGRQCEFTGTVGEWRPVSQIWHSCKHH